MAGYCSNYLERARIARAIKARVLNEWGDAPTGRRDKARKSANDSSVATDGFVAPEPGPRFPANRLKPAT